MSRRARLLAPTLEVLVPLALVGLWAVWSARQRSYYFPPLGDILSAFRHAWLFERVGSDVLPSLGRMGLGFAIASTVGVSLGMALGRSRRGRRAATPFVEFLRAIPPPALIPIGLVAFGIGDGMKVFIIGVVCVWPILLNTIDGAAGIDPALEEVTRVYGIDRRDRIRHVLLPAAGPQIFAGLRAAVPLALIVMVISEMVASTNGIGYFILEAQRTFAIPEMWSGILLLGILGFTLNGATVLIERRVLRWHRESRASALR
jgi:ABC-type nitrate/sulfonate/bicarbonate transport system permease component